MQQTNISGQCDATEVMKNEASPPFAPQSRELAADPFILPKSDGFPSVVGNKAVIVESLTIRVYHNGIRKEKIPIGISVQWGKGYGMTLGRL